MSHYSWQAIVTAGSGIVHGGDTLGTVTYLRRERILTPHGEVEDIPVISGNSVRGRLRALAVDSWWADRQEPALPTATAHALFSGGSLTRATDEPLSGSRLLRVHEVCPPLEIFGAAGGGRTFLGMGYKPRATTPDSKNSCGADNHEKEIQEAAQLIQ